eukprot:Nk52_evm4s2612 gene=Nk52_evmTU4s2612
MWAHRVRSPATAAADAWLEEDRKDHQGTGPGVAEDRKGKKTAGGTFEGASEGLKQSATLPASLRKQNPPWEEEEEERKARESPETSASRLLTAKRANSSANFSRIKSAGTTTSTTDSYDCNSYNNTKAPDFVNRGNSSRDTTSAWESETISKTSLHRWLSYEDASVETIRTEILSWFGGSRDAQPLRESSKVARMVSSKSSGGSVELGRIASQSSLSTSVSLDKDLRSSGNSLRLRKMGREASMASEDGGGERERGAIEEEERDEVIERGLEMDNEKVERFGKWQKFLRRLKLYIGKIPFGIIAWCLFFLFVTSGLFFTIIYFLGDAPNLQVRNHPFSHAVKRHQNRTDVYYNNFTESLGLARMNRSIVELNMMNYAGLASVHESDSSDILMSEVVLVSDEEMKSTDTAMYMRNYKQTSECQMCFSDGKVCHDDYSDYVYNMTSKEVGERIRDALIYNKFTGRMEYDCKGNPEGYTVWYRSKHTNGTFEPLRELDDMFAASDVCSDQYTKFHTTSLYKTVKECRELYKADFVYLQRKSLSNLFTLYSLGPDAEFRLYFKCDLHLSPQCVAFKNAEVTVFPPPVPSIPVFTIEFTWTQRKIADDFAGTLEAHALAFDAKPFATTTERRKSFRFPVGSQNIFGEQRYEITEPEGIDIVVGSDKTSIVDFQANCVFEKGHHKVVMFFKTGNKSVELDSNVFRKSHCEKVFYWKRVDGKIVSDAMYDWNDILYVDVVKTDTDEVVNNHVDPATLKYVPNALDPGLNNGYELVFSDEFENDELATNRWNAHHSMGNSLEDAMYVNTAALGQNTEFDSTMLVLEKGILNLYAGPNVVTPGSAGKPFRAGKVSSRFRFEFLYGKVEIRANLPVINCGVQAVLSLLTLDHDASAGAALFYNTTAAKNDPWSESTGDAFILGSSFSGEAIYQRFSRQDFQKNVLKMEKTWQKQMKNLPTDDGFYIFAVDWSPSEISLSVDGQVNLLLENITTFRPTSVVMEMLVGEPSNIDSEGSVCAISNAAKGVEHVLKYIDSISGDYCYGHIAQCETFNRQLSGARKTYYAKVEEVVLPKSPLMVDYVRIWQQPSIGRWKGFCTNMKTDSPRVDPNTPVSERVSDSGYEMIFSDEFSSFAPGMSGTTKIDYSKWVTKTHSPPYGGIIPELAYYTEDNVWVDKGDLHIIASHKDPSKHHMVEERFDYTAGKVVSNSTFRFKYGKVEMRAKFPNGCGFVSALWMIHCNEDPFSPICNVWPPEIDFVEYMSWDYNAVHQTYHFVGESTYNTGDGITSPLDSKTNFTEDYHLYGVEWGEDFIKFTVDGEVTKTLTSGVYKGFNEADVGKTMKITHKEMYFVMNSAIGGGIIYKPGFECPIINLWLNVKSVASMTKFLQAEVCLLAKKTECLEDSPLLRYQFRVLNETISAALNKPILVDYVRVWQNKHTSFESTWSGYCEKTDELL